MITRRGVLHAVAGIAALALASTPALADWKETYKELVIAAVPDENATGIERRYEPFRQYLEKQLGVPVVDHWWQTETGWAICGNFQGLDPMPVKLGSTSVPAARANRLATNPPRAMATKTISTEYDSDNGPICSA